MTAAPSPPAPGAGLTDEERLALAGLVRVIEPGNRRVAEWLESSGPLRAWAELQAGQAPVGAELRAAFATRLAAVQPERDLELGARAGARLIGPGDPEWPVTLQDLWRTDYPPPAGLWLRGARRLDELADQAVGIVGSRAATDYGLHVAGELAAALTEWGWTVISGGAYGIDGAAHRGALGVDGPTVAVLACGVDVPYPRGHARLLASIAANGLVLSEWAPGCAPHKHRFLVRNRLIAALSTGVVVVEAGVRSGARTTAKYARQMLRHTMAVPGPVTSAVSAGCHVIVRDEGAVLVTNQHEILAQVGRLGLDLPPRPVGERRPADDLTPAQRQLLDAVPLVQPVPAQSIAVIAGLGSREATRALRQLEVRRFVEERGGRWRRAHPGSGETSGGAP